MAGVVAEGLTKRFGPTEALQGLDLEARPATVLGVLGPNGAGKTTAVRILTTLLRPDGGRAFVDGVDVLAEPNRVRARIGLTGQYAAVDERLTGRENLRMTGYYYHLPTKVVHQRADELLERLDLTDAGDRMVNGYSGGMRRRLDIAMSLIAEPSVLFLDEPTTGLDPRSRLGMWDLISGLVRDGTTLLLTTQYLEEAERLADDIVVIDHGTVIARGTTPELKQQVGGERLAVQLCDAADAEAARNALAVLACGEMTVEADTTLLVPIREPDGAAVSAVRALDGAGLVVRDLAVRRPSLDDVFLTLTGHRAEQEGADTVAPTKAGRR
jgi:ABC-2 type transport system ATP-binding protein